MLHSRQRRSRHAAGHGLIVLLLLLALSGCTDESRNDIGWAATLRGSTVVRRKLDAAGQCVAAQRKARMSMRTPRSAGVWACCCVWCCPPAPGPGDPGLRSRANLSCTISSPPSQSTLTALASAQTAANSILDLTPLDEMIMASGLIEAAAQLADILAANRSARQRYAKSPAADRRRSLA